MTNSSLKNVQVIDGALNCTYDIFAVPENDFDMIFPAPGQDIEFVEDFFDRDEAVAQRIWTAMWTSKVDKKSAQGVHGTIFCGLETKRQFYPTKREGEMTSGL